MKVFSFVFALFTAILLVGSMDFQDAKLSEEIRQEREFEQVKLNFQDYNLVKLYDWEKPEPFKELRDINTDSLFLEIQKDLVKQGMMKEEEITTLDKLGAKGAIQLIEKKYKPLILGHEG